MVFSSLRRSIGTNLRNVFLSTNFLISVLLVFGVLLAENLEDIVNGSLFNNRVVDPAVSFAAYKFNLSLHFGYYVYAAPIACAFAASGLFCNDVESGYYRLRLLKSGKRAYQYGLFLGGTLGGGFALMVGTILYALTCIALYIPNFPAQDLPAPEAWLPILSAGLGGLWYMLLHSMLAFLFGMVWSGVGLTISVFYPTRYVSYLTPFIVCFCSVIVLPESFQPLEMLVQLGWATFTFGKALLYQFSLYTFIFSIFLYALRRRYLHV